MAHLNEKYDKILQAAIEVISEKGLDKTTVSDIVKKAGIAQGTFYLYFRSKNALIPAIAENLLTHSLKKIKQEVVGTSDFWEKLEVFISETYHITDEYRDVLVLCYSGLAFDYSLETWEAIYKPYYEWFEEILHNAIEQKEIIGNFNVEWTAKMIINLVENTAERFYIAKDQNMGLEETKKELFEFLKRSLLLKS
ncbi:TetR family transcriptional regulator [Domibacillus sp. DTU_2020_1001157_1_SI_ALB_TIR_016]|uniref:TetR family transcriptional regulator n=1 Tax=Domibacillus sp. DTU_2020_1001157_1_SI_ALB_TIR_016 TaxID=3077789 RepID=UPI0028F03386|nr:TetR family transcriptional regulator [Domibacillus sp. DTU_2020_1001157_1_SI_ALB_TIR_016]WNS78522.1 TetR family transcriptional regulator [Domibacillus sp. DTU_2020_1001157_1_SI_ALB_TIR_016]